MEWGKILRGKLDDPSDLLKRTRLRDLESSIHVSWNMVDIYIKFIMRIEFVVQACKIAVNYVVGKYILNIGITMFASG